MPRGRLYVIALVSLLAILAINTAIRNSGAPAARPGSTSERQDAPELSLPIEPGKPAVLLSSLKGKVVLLDFWATWCGPCRDSIPDVENLYKKYHSKGLEVIGISVDHTPEPVPAAVAQLGMTYPVVQAADIPEIRSKFQFDSIPQLYVIDKQGRVAASITGATGDFEAQITPFLAE